MNSDDTQHLPSEEKRLYEALRSDLSPTLAAFDRAQDWADLIHDLQRVNRVLNKYTSVSLIPEKHLLAKRLAQCLTSFLPSGVHLKALETYHIVFSRISTQQLAKDLPIYAGGLFPLLSHCSTSLKGPLLSLYETHFLPLGPSLGPVLGGLVLAILPGLEDETSEFYSRARNILDRIADAVGDVGVFARSIWRALLLSPPARSAASQYIRSKLAAGHDELRTEMVGDMPLVAFAITSALSDIDTLTQRNVLDLLLGELALDSLFFQGKSVEHRDAAIAVVGGVFGTLLRKDMSLTKRVHAWFLGGKDGDAAISFCTKYSNDFVLAALDNETAKALESWPGNRKSATRPCQVAAALLQRQELTECLGHHLALRVLEYGRQVDSLRPSDDTEIRGSITELLHDIGSAKVFAELERNLSQDRQSNHELFDLLSYTLSIFPTKDVVVRRNHLPALLTVAVQSLNALSSQTSSLDKAVSFCSKAMHAMGLSKEKSIGGSLRASVKSIVSSFASFFVAWLASAVQAAPVELRRAYGDVSVSEEYSAESAMASTLDTRKEHVELAKSACSFFVAAASSAPGDLDVIGSCLQSTAKCASAADVRISLAGANSFARVASNALPSDLSKGSSSEQIHGVIRRCWRQMHPSLRTATPQSAQAFLALQKSFPEECTVVLADGMLSSNPSRRLRNLERFACLWRLAVEHRLVPLPSEHGLFLMLDALTDEHWGPKMLARSWLSDALQVDPPSVLDPPLRLLLTSESRTFDSEHEFKSVYDAPRSLYAFQILRGVLDCCQAGLGSTSEQTNFTTSSQNYKKNEGRGKSGLRALATTPPSPRIASVLASVFASGGAALPKPERSPVGDSEKSTEGEVELSHLLPAHNYLVCIALACLGYLRGTVPSKFRQNVDDFDGSETRPVDQRQSNRNGVSNGEAGTTVHQHSDTSNTSQGEVDLEWTLAGLGNKSLDELHAGVCAAAAECFASLLSCIPVPSEMSSILANQFAAPLIRLVHRRLHSSDPVLELHFLSAMSFLITADGPSYISAMRGRESFTQRISRRRLSQSDSQHNVSQRRLEPTDREVQIGPAEALDQFVPWLLCGLISTFRNPQTTPDSGSQEVLGIRRRWIQFMDTVMKNIGVTVPVVTEGSLLVLSELLRLQSESLAEQSFTGENEFSKVDETLVFLEGLFVVSSNVLWSFENALADGDLKDDNRSSCSDGSTANDEPTSKVMNPEGFGPRDQESRSIQSSVSRESVQASDNGPLPSLVEKAANVSNATSAMINALNPLRMINDFVKDVFTGGTNDGSSRLLDPRRSGARLLFCLLPELLQNMAIVWGPTLDLQQADNDSLLDSSADRGGPPRLSTELPRERRQAQRSAVLAVLEPVLELWPVNVVSAVIALFCKDQDQFGDLPTWNEGLSPSKASCYLLHAMDHATVEVVVSCVKTVFEKAVKWDSSSSEAVQGRSQATFREKARQEVEYLMDPTVDNITQTTISAIGRSASGDGANPLPGGIDAIDSIVPPNASDSARVGHQDHFSWGDYFASYAPTTVETASFNFLERYLSVCSDEDNVLSVWTILQPLLKDCLASVRRKSSVPSALRVLKSFVIKCPTPFPDRRVRREIMLTSTSIISSCATIAKGQGELSNSEQGNVLFFKKRLAVVALSALSESVPVLVDSCFLDDKPQLTSSVLTSLSPSVHVLKKAASRAVALETASKNAKRPTISSENALSKQTSETEVDVVASRAAADVILNIGSRDWGSKLVRKELVSLLEDSNFFYCKGRGVLQKLSVAVREIVSSGGASFLFTSLSNSITASSPGIPSLFTGRDSETVLRARATRRMTYCVFVAEPDFYSPQLPFILERIRDALRLNEARLVTECLFCLRALLIRTGANSISAFRATTLAELFRIISNPVDDLEATLAALRFLDLVTLLSPPPYGYERCFFFGESTGSSLPLEDEESIAFQPLVSKVAELWTPERGQEELFEAPLRLERGKTVLPGKPPSGFGKEFIGRYATALIVRNASPKMNASSVSEDAVCSEFELEFLE